MAKQIIEYAEHRKGSIKSLVHNAFDTKGYDAAFIFGRKQGIKESSLRTWINTWRREAGQSPRQLAAQEAGKKSRKPAANGKAASKGKAAPGKAAKGKPAAKAAKGKNAPGKAANAKSRKPVAKQAVAKADQPVAS